MRDITEKEWQLLREEFGDLAYEEPHNHQRFLAVIEGSRQVTADDVEDTDVIIGLDELDRDDLVELDVVVKKAKSILAQKL